MKNNELLESFIKYCEENPEQRFWQALRNWSGYSFIMGWSPKYYPLDVADSLGLQDTFYLETKHHEGRIPVTKRTMRDTIDFNGKEFAEKHFIVEESEDHIRDVPKMVSEDEGSVYYESGFKAGHNAALEEACRILTDDPLYTDTNGITSWNSLSRDIYWIRDKIKEIKMSNRKE